VVPIRELELEDYEAVRELHLRNGLRMADEAQWARLWADNPHADQFRAAPRGWVIESPGRKVAGAVCTVPVMYDFGGRALRASAGMAWVVDPEHRSKSLLLLEAYFSQDAVDLLLNTSANPVAGKVWQAYRAQRLPSDDYDQNLMWVTGYGAFAKAATQRLARRGARFLQLPIVVYLAGQNLLRRMRSRAGLRNPDTAAVHRLEHFDSQFDAFWSTLKSEGEPKLRAVRDAKSLAWHFAPGLKAGNAVILTCSADGSDAIDGYLVAIRKDRSDIDLRRYQVADLQVKPGREEMVRPLIAEALRIARSEGVAAVELTGFDGPKRSAAQQLPHHTRRLETWPFFFKTRDPQLHAQLQSPRVWDPSPFDGDATL
jgi:hypothetical protein